MKTIRTKEIHKGKNITRKNRKRLFYPQQFVPKIISKKDTLLLKRLIGQFFEKDIQTKMESFPDPFPGKYSDIVERKKGRFEITPPSSLRKKIWNCLLQNKSFVQQREKIHKTILENTEKCKEEMGILPIEPHTRKGDWHRDIFVSGNEDFQKPPFYITQIIYLDDNANTRFCVNSETNPDNNPKKYLKKQVTAQTGSSVIFDGRILHQGLENKSDEIRYAIYIVYYTSTYVDNENLLESFLDKTIHLYVSLK